MIANSTIMILCGGYGCVSSSAKIFDAIHMNGRGGHSFEVYIGKGFTDSDKIKNVGGFDGDGSDSISFICSGVDGKELLFDSMIKKYPPLKENSTWMRKESGKGDCVLIVKGSPSGIESLKYVFDKTLDYINQDASNNNGYGSATLYTDDDAEINCGTLHSDLREGGTEFGFYIVTDDNQDFDNVLDWMTADEKGMDVNFYRRG